MRLLLTLLLFIVSLQATDRIALLIGNKNYSFAPLTNPLNDVKVIKSTLISIGFKEDNIKVLQNATKPQIDTALYNFGLQAESADIALVYFSGHGLQVGGTNYLMPTEVKARSHKDLVRLINLDRVIDTAGVAKAGVVLIDACRDNPLSDNFSTSNSKSGNFDRGLAQITPKKGLKVIVGFATQSGQIAQDGRTDNSPYAIALKSALKLNRDITKVLGAVNEDVLNATGSQMPMFRSTLGRRDVCLTGSCSQKVVIDNSQELARLRAENAQYREQSSRVVIPVPKPIQVVSTSKWLKPTNRVCEANGGKLYKGVCKANWKNAKKICSASGGKLPSRADLKKVVVDCGGIVNSNWHGIDATKNNNNTSYQSCYKEKDFSDNNYYWTREEKDSSSAWGVLFDLGDDRWHNKSFHGYALCVR